MSAVTESTLELDLLFCHQPQQQKIKSGMYITIGPISMMRWVDDISIYPFPYLSIHLVIYHTIEFVLIEIKLVFLRKLLHEASFCVTLVETLEKLKYQMPLPAQVIG